MGEDQGPPLTGLPLSLFNGCVVQEPATPAELDAALKWVVTRRVPHRVFVVPELAERLRHVPEAHGLRREPETYPGMVLPHPAAPPAPAAGVTVEPVAESGLDEYVGIHVEGGLPPELARALFPPSLAADPEARLFTGRLDGRPVGTSLAIRSGDASGVYAVGTLPAARRRGVGSALTWAAVAAGRAWGCETVVLQSSAMALSMYTAMGFRTAVPYTTFTSVT